MTKMNREYIEVKIPILDDVKELEVVKTFNQEQLWYVYALAKAFEDKIEENKKLRHSNNKKKKLLIDYSKRISLSVDYCHKQLGFLENCVTQNEKLVSELIKVHKEYDRFLKRN